MLDELKRRIDSWFSRTTRPAGHAAFNPAPPDRRPATAEALEHYRLGLQHLNESRAAEALSCFDLAIAASPGLADAHHCAGLALRKLGRREEAAASFQRAIDIEPHHVRALSSHGMMCLDLGRDEEASDSFNLALAFDPNCAAALLGLGALCQRQKRANDAIGYYRRAVELDAESPGALASLSALSQELGNDRDALMYLERVSALTPNVAEVECNLGVLLLKAGRTQDAAARLRRAIALRTEFPEAHFNLGNALCKCDDLHAGIECYHAALALRPEYPEAYRNLGNAYRLCGEPERALASSRMALSLRPDYAEAQLDMGAASYDLGRVHDAIACYQRALAFRVDYPEAQLNLGLAWLAIGDFERGWAGYDWRFRQTDPDNHVVKRAFAPPEWRGEELAGRSILIWAEQGISDQLLFAGMFAEIARAARSCVIECAEKLVPLLARSFPAAHVVPLTDPPHPDTQAGLDFQVGAGSLARWLRPTLASFPHRAGYLVADEKRVEYWRSRVAALGAGLKVGFSWRSGNLKGVRALFSTQLDQWGELFRIPGVHWVCLQYDDCGTELEAASRRSGVELHRFDSVNYFDDLDEVSALVTALDLVISAPTAVSVQAAALGREVWQMNYGVDWQAHGTSGNPWLPTLTRYERRADRSWDDVISDIARQLAVRARK